MAYNRGYNPDALPAYVLTPTHLIVLRLAAFNDSLPLRTATANTLRLQTRRARASGADARTRLERQRTTTTTAA